MFTNDLKKGTRVRLRNGWYATLEDNKKGNVRMATVEGFTTEMGSIYAHDIVEYAEEFGTHFAWRGNIQYTPQQLKTAKTLKQMGW